MRLEALVVVDQRRTAGSERLAIPLHEVSESEQGSADRVVPVGQSIDQAACAGRF
jgi:hypothetical protein